MSLSSSANDIPITVCTHLASITWTFYVVNTTFEMGCMVTNVTKTHRCRQVRMDRFDVACCKRGPLLLMNEKNIACLTFVAQ